MSGKYKNRLIIEHIFAYLYVHLSWYKWDRSKQFRMENSTGFDAKLFAQNIWSSEFNQNHRLV